MSEGDGRAAGGAVRADGDGRDEASSRAPRALRPFRHREYRLLIASGSASLLADGSWLVALVC